MNNRKSEFTTIVQIYGQRAAFMPFQVNVTSHLSDEMSWGLPLRPHFCTYEEAVVFADKVDEFMAEYKADIIREYKEENA